MCFCCVGLGIGVGCCGNVCCCGVGCCSLVGLVLIVDGFGCVCVGWW